jgi:hypothetical protein
MNPPYKNDNNYDRLWKLRTLCDQLNDAYAEFCSPFEHLAVDEIIVLFKGRVISKTIYSKETNTGIRIHKLYNMTCHTYNMNVNFEKVQAKSNTDDDSYTCNNKTSRRVMR